MRYSQPIIRQNPHFGDTCPQPNPEEVWERHKVVVVSEDGMATRIYKTEGQEKGWWKNHLHRKFRRLTKQAIHHNKPEPTYVSERE